MRGGVTGRVAGLLRPLAAVVAAATALTSCAHLQPDEAPVAVIDQAIRHACTPFVVDGVDRDEVGRQLGAGWFRTPPDPFTPALGGLFRRGSATIRVDDGRSARTPDGALTTRPVRICNLWLGRPVDELSLISGVTVSAAGYRPDAIIVYPVRIDGARRTVACLPAAGGRVVVVNALVFSNGEGGASVYEAPADAPDCLR